MFRALRSKEGIGDRYGEPRLPGVPFRNRVQPHFCEKHQSPTGAPGLSCAPFGAGWKARPGVSAPAYALSSTRARPLPPPAPQWVRLNSLPPPQAFGKASLGIAVPPEQDGVPLFITACGYCSCSGSASGPSPRAWAWQWPVSPCPVSPWPHAPGKMEPPEHCSPFLFGARESLPLR